MIRDTTPDELRTLYLSKFLLVPRCFEPFRADSAIGYGVYGLFGDFTGSLNYVVLGGGIR